MSETEEQSKKPAKPAPLPSEPAREILLGRRKLVLPTTFEELEQAIAEQNASDKA